MEGQREDATSLSRGGAALGSDAALALDPSHLLPFLCYFVHQQLGFRLPGIYKCDLRSEFDADLLKYRVRVTRAAVGPSDTLQQRRL